MCRPDMQLSALAARTQQAWQVRARLQEASGPQLAQHGGGVGAARTAPAGDLAVPVAENQLRKIPLQRAKKDRAAL